MNKLDMLFIRACKSKDPYKRVCSVYKRFYCEDTKQRYNLIGIMSSIVDKYGDITLSHFINETSPDSPRNVLDEDKTYWKVVLRVLINEFRFKEVDKLKQYDYIPGLYWRNREKRL